MSSIVVVSIIGVYRWLAVVVNAWEPYQNPECDNLSGSKIRFSVRGQGTKIIQRTQNDIFGTWDWHFFTVPCTSSRKYSIHFVAQNCYRILLILYIPSILTLYRQVFAQAHAVFLELSALLRDLCSEVGNAFCYRSHIIIKPAIARSTSQVLSWWIVIQIQLRHRIDWRSWRFGPKTSRFSWQDWLPRD